jgi:outer membrane protein assembly factor BamB
VASVDPEGYSVSFRCAWGNGDTSGWGLWASEGETTELAYAWPQVGQYDVTAQARDVQEVLSNWSESFSMLVGNPPRTPTRPDGPANGWIDSTYSYTVVATDIDGDDIRYAFDWGEGAVETTAFHETGQYATLGHVWTRPDSYDLRVMALDRPGLNSDWSTVLRAAIRDPLGPGVVKWTYAAGGEVQSAPALDAAGRVYFGCADSAMYCLNPDSTLAWRFATGSWITSSPAISLDGSVYFGSFDGNLYALSETGVEQWRFSTGDEIWSSPALALDGTIYIGSGDGNLYAVNPDGSERWRFATGDMVVSSPAVGADGRVYCGSQDS